LARLEEKGVIFARLEDLEGVESYSAVYNGEVLVQSGSAADLRKSLDSAWSKTGDDLVKELDIMFLKKQGKRYNRKQNKTIPTHREYAKKLSRTELREIREGLNELDVDLEIHSSSGAKVVENYYNTVTGNPVIMKKTAAAMLLIEEEQIKMVLRKGATHYEFFHEYMHFRHSQDISVKEYLALGSGEYSPGRLVKEQWVYDKIIQHREFFNQSELKHALKYINKVRKDPHGKYPLEFDFDIDQIPKTRENINIEELFSKK
jgi:hypothetical protein